MDTRYINRRHIVVEISGNVVYDADRGKTGGNVVTAQTPTHHVLLLYRELIPSLVLCGHVQMKELHRQGCIEYRICTEKKIGDTDFNWAEIVLLGRPDNWLEYKLVKRFHEAGKLLIYILDDDLLHIADGLGCTLHYRAKETRKYLKQILTYSDAILSPSPRLLAQYADEGQCQLLTEEPAIRIVDFVPHDPLMPVKIGFSGSLDRIGDVEVMLREVLVRVKNKYGKRVLIEFFGVNPSFAKQIDAYSIPYCETYEKYLACLEQRNWDIGLAPMPDTPFHSCKHYIKLIEYSSVGIASVLSDVEPYTRVKTTFDRARFCANTTDEWFAAICELLDDRTALEAARLESNQVVRQKMNLTKVSDALWEQIKRIIPPGELLSSGKHHLGWLRICYFPKRVQALFSTYGWKTPCTVFWKVVQKINKMMQKRD